MLQRDLYLLFDKFVSVMYISDIIRNELQVKFVKLTYCIDF